MCDHLSSGQMSESHADMVNLTLDEESMMENLRVRFSGALHATRACLLASACAHHACARSSLLAPRASAPTRSWHPLCTQRGLDCLLPPLSVVCIVPACARACSCVPVRSRA